MKQAFSFLELLVVILILLILYGVFFSNMSFEYKNKKEEALNLNNLKSYLIKHFDFERKLQLVCLKYEKLCYVFLDDVKNKKNTLPNFLPEGYTVYTYEKQPKKQEFSTVEFQNLESYEVSFEFNIEYNKSDTMIIDTNQEIILYHAIEKPTLLERMSQVDDYFEQKAKEVKNAF